MNGTGAGLEGIALSTFQEEVVNKTCRFYHQLKPVMMNRPNVRPWVTNDDSSEDDNNNNILEDEESDSSSVQYAMEVENIDSDDEVCVVEHDQQSRCPTVDAVIMTTSKRTTSSSSSTNIDDSTSSITNNSNTCNTISVHSSSQNSSNNQQNNKRAPSKITPSDAKKKHKSLLRQGKKQITSTGNKSKIATLLQAEQEDRNFMMESRKDKMEFEAKKHDEMKEIEIKKLGIEEKRFKLDEVRLQAQTEIDKQKLLLVQMEVFEKREQMKRNNPHIDEEEINKRFSL